MAILFMHIINVSFDAGCIIVIIVLAVLCVLLAIGFLVSLIFLLKYKVHTWSVKYKKLTLLMFVQFI